MKTISNIIKIHYNTYFSSFMWRKISLLKFQRVEKSGFAARTCSVKESDSWSISPFFLWNKEKIIIIIIITGTNTITSENVKSSSPHKNYDATSVCSKLLVHPFLNDLLDPCIFRLILHDDTWCLWRFNSAKDFDIECCIHHSTKILVFF